MTLVLLLYCLEKSLIFLSALEIDVLGKEFSSHPLALNVNICYVNYKNRDLERVHVD